MFGRLLLSVTAMIVLRSAPCLSVALTTVEGPNEDQPNQPLSLSETLRANLKPSESTTGMRNKTVPDCFEWKTEDDLDETIVFYSTHRKLGELYVCPDQHIPISRPLSFNFSSDVKITVICMWGNPCRIEAAAGYSGSFLTLSGGGTLQFVNFVFGNFVGTTDAGVIVVKGSTLVLDSCAFNSNKAIGGGCIASYGGTLTIRDSRFENNNATSNGGAVLIADGGLASISKTSFFNNSAYTGGAVAFVNGGTSSIADCNFDSNHASYEGGAIWQNQNSTLTVTNSLFVTNAARRAGGAFANVDAKITVVNGNKFFNHTAVFGGAGFVAKQVGIEMDSSNQFAGNGAGHCGNVLVYETSRCIPPNMVTSEA